MSRTPFRFFRLSVALAATAALITPAVAWTSAPFIIYFSLASDRLASVERTKLDRLAAIMIQDPSLHLIIRGHADRAGSDASNILLSCRRARSVRDYLVTSDVSPNRVAIEALGEAQPMTSGPEGRLEEFSRRVDFAFTDARLFAARRYVPPC